MEIKKEDLDRIVITSNDQMQKIIDWYNANINYIIKVTNDSMELPIYDGLICYEEENIQFEFHDLGKWVRVVVYMFGREEWVEVYGFEVNPSCRTPGFEPDKIFTPQGNNTIRNLKFNTADKKRISQLKTILTIDNQIGKLMFKFFAIISFMLFAEEIVEIDHSQDQPRTRRVARAMKIRNQPLSLVRKTYVIKNFDPKKTKIKGAPRKWTAPDREVAVRGHYRHLKSGKVVWVRECTKFKEKGNRKPKEWKM